MKCITKGAVCLALVLAAGAGTGRAADPQPAVVGRASVKSVEEVTKFIGELGIPLPGDLRNMIEQGNPVVGPGGLAADKPLGMMFVVGDTVPAKKSIITALPVVAGKATKETLIPLGATASENQPDVMMLRGQVSLKRTANYLLMYPGEPEQLAPLGDDMFARDYAQPGRLALATIDMVKLRAAAPAKYHAWVDPIDTRNGMWVYESLSIKWAAKYLRGYVDKIERATLAVGRDANNVRLEAWLMPFELKGGHAFPQPAFPPGVVAQVHMVYPDAATANWVANYVDLLPASQLADIERDEQMTEAEAWVFKPLLVRFVRLLSAADAQSVAIEIKQGKPVIYICNQYAGAVDIVAQMKALVADNNAARKKFGKSDDMELAALPVKGDARGLRVWLTSSEGKREPVIDIMQNGQTVRMTISEAPGDYLQVLDLPPAKAANSNFCSGSIDVAALLTSASSSADSLPLPPATLQELQAAAKGQPITWTVKASEQGKYLYADLQLPMPVLKQIGKMANLFLAGFGGPAGPRGSGARRPAGAPPSAPLPQP